VKGMRRILFVAGLAAVAAACGAGTLTLTEYAESVEVLVAEMEGDFRDLDAEWLSEPASLDRAGDYWDGRLDIRREFLDGVEDLRPPERVLAQHEAALDVFSRITAADETLADSVAEWDSIEDHWQWVETPEGRAADAILAEVYAFCRSSQEEFDATRQGEPFEETPWISSDIEVVKVAFGCPPAGSD